MEDTELADAIVQYAMMAGEGPNFDSFVEVLTAEVAKRGHLRCEKCSRTLREHVLAALRAGGARLNHNFTCVGK